MSAKKENNGIPSDNLVLYEELIKTNSGIERKGVKLPYTSFNGHMFTFLSESGILAIRLPENERESFLKQYNSALMESQGIVMKEYVAVPESLLKNTNELKKYLDMSYEYVKTLKPKAKKKSKKISKTQ